MPPGTMPDGQPWPEGYVIDYQNLQTGAAVFAPLNWREDRVGQERRIAQLLADTGRDVVFVLKAVGHGVKYPDAFVIEDSAASLWEFKSLISGKNYVTFAQRSIREGSRQAPTVLLFFGDEDADPDIIEDINRGIATALLFDRSSRLKRVALLHSTGDLQVRSREDFLNGKVFGAF